MIGRRALPAVVLLVLSSAILRADYRENFQRGMRAFNRSQWAVAIKELTAAIAQKPQNSGESVVISGIDTERYFPHYYLGQALFASGDCAGALDAWRRLEEQNATPRLGGDQRRQLTANRQKCEQQLSAKPKPEEARLKPDDSKPKPDPKPDPPPPPRPDPAVALAIQQAEGAVSQAEEAQRRVADLAADDMLRPIWRDDSRLGGAQGDAEASLKSARSALGDARARGNVDRARDASAAATRAREGFDRIHAAGTARLTDLRRATAEKKPEATPPPPKPEAAARRTVPPQLLRAAQLYFSGRYADAAAALDGQRYADAAENLQAELFRAASAYALYATGGERDAALRDRASASVRACRRLDPRFAPDAASFSPRFVQFYRDVR